MPKKLLMLLPLLVIVAAGYGGVQWWRDWRFQQSTDDAYVESDISLISPKIEGYIKEVRVEDNQHVKAGDVLFVIDDSDFAAKVQQGQAAVDAEVASVATFETRHDEQLAMINQATAEVEASKAEVSRADLDQKRYVSLVASASKPLRPTRPRRRPICCEHKPRWKRQSSNSPCSMRKNTKSRRSAIRRARCCASRKTTSTTR